MPTRQRPDTSNPSPTRQAGLNTYSYAKDGRLVGIVYTGAVNPTPNVGFTWDP